MSAESVSSYSESTSYSPRSDTSEGEDVPIDVALPVRSRADQDVATRQAGDEGVNAHQTPKGDGIFHTSRILPEIEKPENLLATILTDDWLQGALERYREWFTECALVQTASSETKSEDTLQSSYVGQSLWTSVEKEALFQSLPRFGRRNLVRLAEAIGTKTEFQVAAYLRSLENASRESQHTACLQPELIFQNTSAAHETSKELGSKLDQLAGLLVTEEERAAFATDRIKYGADWLIDESVAADLEGLYFRECEESAKFEMEFQTADEDVDMNLVDTKIIDGTGPDTDVDSADRREAPDATISTSQIGRNDGFPEYELSSSTRLFSPAQLLHLSSTVFMNGPPGTGHNWIDHTRAQDQTVGPAILRSTLDDLFGLTVDLTKRIVQTVIFQAMTRIRALDTRYARLPSLTVETSDIHIACKMLNLEHDRRTFWSEAPERHRLDVYTESKRYKDGRPGTQNGVKLTYEEVETELGLHKTDELTTIVGDDINSDSDVDGHISSDQWTEPDDDHDKLMTAAMGNEILSPRRLRRACELLLEKSDQEASLMEEAYLRREIFGSETSTTISPDASRAPRLASLLKRTYESAENDWYITSTHRNEWESNGEGPGEQDFAETDHRGRTNRKRRKLFESQELSRLARARKIMEEKSRKKNPTITPSGNTTPDPPVESTGSPASSSETSSVSDSDSPSSSDSDLSDDSADSSGST